MAILYVVSRKEDLDNGTLDRKVTEIKETLVREHFYEVQYKRVPLSVHSFFQHYFEIIP